MSSVIVAVLVVGGIIGLYFLSYVMNKNTPMPEGVDPIEECNTCNTTSCSHHPENIKEDIKEYYDKQKGKPECDI